MVLAFVVVELVVVGLIVVRVVVLYNRLVGSIVGVGLVGPVV